MRVEARVDDDAAQPRGTSGGARELCVLAPRCAPANRTLAMKTPEREDPLVGGRFGEKYRVVTRLGGGAIGTVYKAKQVVGGPPVAIKVLHAEYASHPEARARFEREATALSALRHPNVIGVIEFGSHDAGLYLVMEYGEGQPLDAMIAEAPLEPAVALLLADQVLAGLGYAHAHGILHRDLKAENVLVAQSADGSPIAKLLDFGLAKFADKATWGDSTTLTAEGSVMGTPAYMAPEQALGAKVDARADVYSAGVLLFELLTGQWPFYADDLVGLLRAHALDAVPSLEATREGLRAQPGLDALIARAMAKKAKDRFADANAMRVALRAVPRPAATLIGS